MVRTSIQTFLSYRSFQDAICLSKYASDLRSDFLHCHFLSSLCASDRTVYTSLATPLLCQELLSNFIREDQVQEGIGNQLSDGLRGGEERAGLGRLLLTDYYPVLHKIRLLLRLLYNLKAPTSFVP